MSQGKTDTTVTPDERGSIAPVVHLSDIRRAKHMQLVNQLLRQTGVFPVKEGVVPTHSQETTDV